MSMARAEFDGSPSEPVYSMSNLVRDRVACEVNLSNLDAVADAKEIQPKHGYEKRLFRRQVNVLNAEINLCAGSIDGTTKLGEERQLIEDYCTSYSKSDVTFCSDQPLKNCISHVKNDQDCWMQGFDDVINDSVSKTPTSKNVEEFQLDLDSHWIGVENVEPWWHTADKDELSSSVSQRSLQQIKYSDVLKTSSQHFEKGTTDCRNCSNQVEEQIPGEETKESDVAECAGGDLASIVEDEFPGPKESVGTLSSNDSYSAVEVDKSDTQQQASANLSRAQLLEALCHSQTRAREAEKLAQEACDEKEHIINLLFRQASHLFAYRQWLQILQLETLCLQLRNKTLPYSTSFQPLVKRNDRIVRKNQYRTAKFRSHKKSCPISKCTVAFALGLSLAGAGLLVGWTIGWLFPAR